MIMSIIGPLHVGTTALDAIFIGELPPDERGTADLDFLNTSVSSLEVNSLSASSSRVC